MFSIIDLLVADHATIRSLLERIMADPKPPDACQLFEAFHELTSVHLQFEQDVVYPLFSRLALAADAVGRAYGDHAEIRSLLASLNQQNGNVGISAAMMSVLNQDLEYHFSDEERDLLPLLRKNIDQATLESLGADYIAAKDFALSHADAATAKAWSLSW